MVKPLNDERLAQIKRDCTYDYHGSSVAVDDITDLLVEVERLRAENKHMREDLKNFQLALELAGGFVVVVPADTPSSADGT